MWNKVKPLLIILSVTLNVAFVAVWAAHALPARLGEPRGQRQDEEIWCPLHRRLGATEGQWREIEPRLVEFQTSAGAVRDKVNQARAEFIDLIAAPNPDREAIRVKQEEILAGQKSMQELVIDHILNEKKMLTQEQQKQLFRMMREQSGCAGHGPMMGRMGRGPVRPADTVEEGETAR